MLKYVILAVFTLPFVAYGLLKALISYRSGLISRGSFILRIFFWASIAIFALLAREIYNFLRSNDLTDSPPLSLAEILLFIGVVFALALIIRLYSKLDSTEKRLSDLHEKLSIELSGNDQDRAN